MDKAKLISVEVAYALPNKQVILAVKVPEGTTVFEAAEQSGIARQFAQINLDSDPMGIFGKAVRDPKTESVNAGDRIEIYRPLLVDPKASRAKRAEKVKQQKEEDAAAD